MERDCRKLSSIKRDVLCDMSRLVDQVDWHALGEHNHAYRAYERQPYEKLIAAELPVWDRVIDFFVNRRQVACRGILDVGTFFPYYPTVFKRLGYPTEVVEKSALYGTGYDPIKRYTVEQGIRFHDMDIISDPTDDLPRGYDVLLCAVLEHLNGSPRVLLEKLKALMSADSVIYILVPNMCSIGRVWSMIRGRSPLPSYEAYWHSSYPFEGHNREMTLEELRTLCKLASLKIVDAGSFALPIPRNGEALRARIRNRVFGVLKRMLPAYTDVVYAAATKS